MPIFILNNRGGSHVRNVILICIVVFSSIHCKKNPVYRVPHEAEIYVERFLDEARQRGRDIAIDNLIVGFEKNIVHDGKVYCGCSSEKKEQKVIHINTAGFCWTSGDLYRESIMFHELGHIILGRKHNDAQLPDGNRKSLMSSGMLDNYVNDSITYKRIYYLDELFDPSTALPEWSIVHYQ